MNPARTLEGQFALVTGASSGIGAECSRALAAAGAAVGINYPNKDTEARKVAADIEAAGGRAALFKADVSSEQEVMAMFEAYDKAFDRIDILIANAGIQVDAAATEMTAEAWQRVIAVNLTGQFLCAREAIRRFRSQPTSTRSRAAGKVICMSSVHEGIPWAGHVNYAASKGGVMLMMKTLAQEVAHYGIRVNAIAPGAIATSINREVWSDAKQREQLQRLIPYKRIGEPSDVARAAVWLASDDSDYVIGHSLFVDGGMSLYPEFVGNG